MADDQIPAEAQEAAAQAIAAQARPSEHSQLCPCWTKRAAIGLCDCWILRGARKSVALAAPHLIAEGRRQAIDVLRAGPDIESWDALTSAADYLDGLAAAEGA